MTPRASTRQGRTHRRGFTLIELMIAVVVVAVLASVALPAYQNYVKRAHRGHAKAALMQLAQWFERAATVNGRYPAAADVPPGLKQVEGGRYTVSVASTATTFTLTAQPGGQQSGDDCGSFVLDQANRQTLSGQAASATAANCWQR